MLNDDELGLALRTFMDREVHRSRPVTIEHVRTRRSRRRPRLHRFAITAVAAALVVIICVGLALVLRRPDAGKTSTPSGDGRAQLVILPGSGNGWLAFALRNETEHGLNSGVSGVVERQVVGSWQQVDYFDASPDGPTHLGSVGLRPASESRLYLFHVDAGTTGPVEWLDVSPLAPGRYRLRGPTATGEFQITDHATAQAPRSRSAGSIAPRPQVVTGAPATQTLESSFGTGNLTKDTEIEHTVSLTLHLRRWRNGEWINVLTRPVVHVRYLTSTVSLPELAPGLYELSRALPTGGAAVGWLFVTGP